MKNLKLIQKNDWILNVIPTFQSHSNLKITWRKNWPKIAVFAVLFLTGFSAFAQFQTPTNIPNAGHSYDAIEAQIDQLVCQTMGNKVPGMTVAVSKKGKLVYSKGFGYANYQRKTPMKRTHRSKIGSVSKIITALGIMKLTEENHNFNLNRKLYFNNGILSDQIYTQAIGRARLKHGTPEGWFRDMKVKHLLSHTVGYGWGGEKNKAKIAQFFGIQESQITYRHYHAYILGDKQVATAPGTNYDYSNHAVGLSALIIKTLTGQEYGRYIDQKIFRPLGLSGKIVPNAHRRDEFDAFPHKYENGRIITNTWPTELKTLDKVSAAGGWAASAESLVRIMVATDKLNNHQDILRGTTIDEMETRPFPVHNSHAIGWGWGSQGRRLSHNGSIPGGRALIIKFKSGYRNSQGVDLSDINIAICANVRIGDGQSELANAIAKIVAQANIPASFDIFKNVPGKYIGVWRPKNTENKLWVGANWQVFNQKNQQFSSQGFNLIDVDTYKKDGKRLYNGVWERSNGNAVIAQAQGWQNFKKKWNDLSKNGRRLIDIETYSNGLQRYFIGVFKTGGGGHYLFNFDHWNKLTAKENELSNKGFRLIDVETFKVGSTRKYLAVFRAGNGNHELFAATNWQTFENKWKQLNNRGLKLVDIQTFRQNGQRHFIGVWKQGSNNDISFKLTWNDFKIERQQMAQKGLFLLDLERI